MAGRNRNCRIEQMCSLFINYIEKRDLNTLSTQALEEVYNKFVGNSPYKVAFDKILDYFASNKYIITGNNGQITFTARVTQLLENGNKTISVPNKVDKLENWYKKLPEEMSNGKEFNTEKNNEKTVRCCFCNCVMPLNSTEEHKKTKQHRAEFLKYMLKRNESDLLQDKYGVSITCIEQSSPLTNIHFSVRPGEVAKRTLQIFFSLSSQEEPISFTSENSVVFTACELLHRLPYISVDDKYKVCDGSKYVEIPDGMSYDVVLTANVDYVGHYCIPLAFGFAFKDGHQPFHVIRWIDLSCIDSTVSSLEPTVPYKPPPQIILSKPAEEIVEGVKPKVTSESELENIVELTNHVIPGELVELIQHKLKTWKLINTHLEDTLILIRKLLSDGVNCQQYECFFETLLYMEEIQMDTDIRKYDLKNVTLNQDKNNRKLLVLEVPGLMENRPSLLRGDKLYVRIRHNNTVGNVEYAGYVHIIRLNEVVLGFNDRLLCKHVKNTRYDVRFTCNKYPLSVMHRAVNFSQKLDIMPILFPRPSACTSSEALEENILFDKSFAVLAGLGFFDRKIEDNYEQATAVRQILSGNSCPAPYLLFGPPGTGKTVTLVEAIKQIWKSNRKSKILVCAPSNSATDLLTQRLITHIPHQQVYRMYAASRDVDKIPDTIKKCSNISSRTGMFVYPSRNVLMKYRLIVTTLVTASKLVSADFDINHFTHIFIDEAGYALEPEAIIPVAGLIQSSSRNMKGGQLILAGDPKQLGPVLRSPEAIQYGLGISLLERLMSIKELYDRKEDSKYDSRFLTKLLKNYRSHPSILQVPNDLFYDGELKVCANKDEREMLSSWEHLPVKGFPVLFHGVIGSDKREERSPSYFNPEEISVVVAYVRKLLDSRTSGVRLQGKDIGLISPYRRQVQKIQNLLQDQKYAGITVGSVEEFQGQERKVIIISTVRSNPNLVALDHEYKLGFLKNPKFYKHRLFILLPRDGSKAFKLHVLPNFQQLNETGSNCLPTNVRSTLAKCQESSYLTAGRRVIGMCNEQRKIVLQRFNVAVTRAKALLIIVGNPMILQRDNHWKSILNYCCVRRSYCGAPYTCDEDEVDDIVQRISCMQIVDEIENNDQVFIPISQKTWQEEPEWRADL